MATKIQSAQKPKIDPSLKISKPRGKSLSKVTLRNRAGKLLRKAIDYPFSGRINNPDYSNWMKNIREGNPEKNLGPQSKARRVKTLADVERSVRRSMGYKT